MTGPQARRRTRLASAAFALLALPSPAAGAGLELRATAVPLLERDPRAEQVGQLRYLGGLALSSPDKRFGGLSGALVSPDGARLDAVSDEGHFVRLRLAHDARGRLVGASGVETGPLLGPAGDVLPTKLDLGAKLDQDAEELARLPDGELVVAFEHRHRFQVYAGPEPSLGAKPAAVWVPPGLAAPPNGGVEAMAALADGRLLAITEELPDPQGGVVGFLRARDGSWSRFAYLPASEPRPSGAAQLPNGDLLVLERSYSPLEGLHIRLVRVAAAEIAPGARLRGSLVAELKPPLTLDNFESLTVRPASEPGDEALVYLLSDDNFNPLQRTLLLLFALRPDSSAGSSASTAPGS